MNKIWTLMCLMLMCLVSLLIPVYAQEGAQVNLSQGPPIIAYTRDMTFSGTLLTHVCIAKTTAKETTSNITAGSQAAAASLTVVGHGFPTGSTPRITISGAGTGNWAGLNGSKIATVTGADTFTVPFNSTGAGDFPATVVLTTTAPRLNQLIWMIQKLTYDGSDNLTGVYYAEGTNAQNKACSLKTTYAYQ